jgi:hypothetical protein
MARVTRNHLARGATAQHSDPVAALDRVLGRLRQNILLADEARERQLRNDDLARRKAASNVEYARGMLTKLEQEALGIKILSRRQDTQVDLNSKRELLNELTDRLKHLEEMGPTEDVDTSEGEDLVEKYMLKEEKATPAESHGSEESNEPLAAISQPQSVLDKALAPETITAGAMRSRTRRSQAPTSTTDTAETTGRSAAASDSRKALLGNAEPSTLSQTATTEAILDHQRAEQDALSESMVAMASSLKAASQAFSVSLDEDKEALSRAGDGLQKSETGLEAAQRRIGMLRRMTEGRGWLGRMMLYGMIFGLMLLNLVVVFVLPKLRF